MTEQRPRFGLCHCQVPRYPAKPTWVECLRWCLMVMNHDDPQLPFAASMLCQFVQKGRLSEKQKKWANDIVSRLLDAYAAGELDCQSRCNRTAETSTSASYPHSLRLVEPEGTA